MKSISAAKPKRVRVSAKPKKSHFEILIGRQKSDVALMLSAADLWSQLYLTLGENGVQAIAYDKAIVDTSRRDFGVKNWMNQRVDLRKEATVLRGQIPPPIRNCLDMFIVGNQPIEACAKASFSSDGKVALEWTRRRIVDALLTFAAIARLPGAN